MANEATLLDRIADPINLACMETAMAKGTILELSGARLAGPTNSDNDIVIGILGREKIAGDGRLSVPVFTQGVFLCAFDAPIAIGLEVGMSGANLLKIATTADKEKGYVLGRTLNAKTSGGVSSVEVLLNI